MAAHVYHVSVTFHDVAACFSAEEWSALENWQKELYRKVMMEVHTALQGMGFEILNPDILFRIKKVKDLYIDLCDGDGAVATSVSSPRESGHLVGVKPEAGATVESCRRRGGKPARPPACTPDLLLRIKQDDASSYRDHHPQSPAHNPADPIVTSVISRQRATEEKREEIHPVERPEIRTSQSQRLVTSQPIKQERLDYIKVSVGGQSSDSTATTTRRRVTSHPVKQEEAEYSRVSVGNQPSDNASVTARATALVTSRPIKQEEVEYSKASVGAQRPDNTTAPSRDLIRQEVLAATIFSPPVDLVHQESLAATVFCPRVDLVQQESLPSAIFSPPLDLVHQESLAEAAVYAPTIDLVHPESLAASVFSHQFQNMGEDSSKDSLEEPSIISPLNHPHSSDIMEDQDPGLESESEHQDRHFSTLNRTLHNLSSHQQESNVLMQEQNSILSQIAYSLNLLHIQQTEGLAALGGIIQQGVEAVRPLSHLPINNRTTDHPSVHTGLRPQGLGMSRGSGNQPIPPKRKIT